MASYNKNFICFSLQDLLFLFEFDLSHLHCFLHGLWKFSYT